MRQAVYDILDDDVTLSGILTGGLYDTYEVTEISRQNTPNAFDSNSEIEPCALLRMGGPNPDGGPYDHSARLTFSLFFYERKGYANTEVARERVYTLLHKQRLTPAGDTVGCWEIRHVQDVPQQEDTGLDCSLEMSRFEAIIRRR